jgi:tripartite-type tricarboxylate transporter receptor subunit TctC
MAGGAAALCALSLGLVPLAAAQATTAHKAKTPLQIGRAFYAGQTITLIAYGNPGSGSDLWARLVVPDMESYLHATINVENVDTAGGIPGQDQAAAATPDGLTIGQINIQTDLGDTLRNLPGLNFNPERLAFLGGPPLPVQVWVATPSVFTTFREATKAAGPVKVVSGTNGVFLPVIDSVFGMNETLLTGYTNPASQLQGLLRGDGPVSEGSMATFGTAIAAGQIKPLLVTSQQKVWPSNVSAIMKSVPSISSYEKQYPPKTAQEKKAVQTILDMAEQALIFTAPGKTPAARVDALRAALQVALTDKSLYSQILNDELTPGFVSGPAAKADYLEAVQLSPSIVKYLNT